MNRVVVTGLGVLAPNGSDLNSFKLSLVNGMSGIKYHRHLEEAGMGCQVGGIPELDETILATYMPANTLKYLNSVPIKYACTAAISAWMDAGLPIDRENADWDTGCVFGCSVCDVDQIKEVTKIVDNRELKKLGLRNIEQLMTSGVSAYISGLLGAANQIVTNSSACATGTESIHMAYERIKLGQAQRMIAGSCEAPSIYIWSNFDNMRLLPRKYNEAPQTASRPMSATACGFVPGSGAGALILENLETALKRGARIYAEIEGSAVNCGAQRNGGSMTAPNKEGVIRCIKQALESGYTDPDSIDLICGHLTATFADKLEVENWSTALNRRKEKFPCINSLKSIVGHCLSAAGSIESIAAILQIYYGFVHPTLNCEDVHPDILEMTGADCIPSTARHIQINKVLKANFGFGDVNACLVLSKYKN